MKRLLAGGAAAALALGAALAAAPAHHGGSPLQGARAMAAAAQLGTADPALRAAPQQDADLVNDEIVVAQLDPLGLPIQAQLISRLASKGGPERTVEDPTSTTNIVYLNQRGRPEVTANGINVQVGGSEPTVTLTEALVNKPLPVALHAEYRLDGQVVDPTQIVGATGEVAVRYTVTNSDIKTKKITYTDGNGRTKTEKQPVFAPFVGTLTVTLPESVQVTDSKTAIVSTNKDGSTILTWQLLLYPPMGNYQQVVSFTSKMDDGVVPGVALTVAPAASSQDPSVSFTSDLLSKSADGNNQLASGLEQLNGSTIQLAQGAAQLATGIGQLADGSTQLSAGFNSELVPGVQQLASGAGQLAAGQQQLTGALGQAAGGAAQLADGLGQLATGTSGLAEGLAQLDAGMPALTSGAEQIRDGAARLADAVGSPTDPPLPTPTPTIPPGPTPIPTPSGTPDFPTPSATPTPTRTPTLVQAVTALARGAEELTDQVVALSNHLIEIRSLLQEARTGSQQVAEDAAGAGAALDELYPQVCPPPGPLTQPQCDALADARDLAAAARTGSDDVAATVLDADQQLAVESLRAYALAFGSHALTEGLDQIRLGVIELSKGLRSGTSQPPGLVEALDALTAGLDELATGVARLDAGAAQLDTGAAGAATGGATLDDGLGQLSAGAGQLDAGTAQLAQGAVALSFGSAQVGAALTQLSSGADQAASGAAQLATGAGQLQKEGTQRIYTSVAKSSAQPALAAAYLTAASDRAASALPYGLPEGATGSAAYVMTMEPVDSSDTTPWQLGALGLLIVAAGAGAVLKTLQSHRHHQPAG